MYMYNVYLCASVYEWYRVSDQLTSSNDVLFGEILSSVQVDCDCSLGGMETTAAEVTKATTTWYIFLQKSAKGV